MNEEDSTNPRLEEMESLAKEMVPPAGLRDRVVTELKRRGLIKGRGVSRWIRAAAAIVASLVLFGGGYIVGGKRNATVSMTEHTFVLFLIEGPQYHQPTKPDEINQRVREYRDWAIQLREKKIPVSGTKLRDDLVYMVDVQRLSPVQLKEQVSGYFLVDAADLQKALEIASSCPHLRYGGRIEVRQVHPV